MKPRVKRDVQLANVATVGPIPSMFRETKKLVALLWVKVALIPKREANYIHTDAARCYVACSIAPCLYETKPNPPETSTRHICPSYLRRPRSIATNLPGAYVVYLARYSVPSIVNALYCAMHFQHNCDHCSPSDKP